jgi:hypothetical protein
VAVLSPDVWVRAACSIARFNTKKAGKDDKGRKAGKMALRAKRANQSSFAAFAVLPASSR